MIHFVTSFNKKIWNDYIKDHFNKWCLHIHPEEQHLWVYYEGEKPVEGIGFKWLTWVNLDQFKDYQQAKKIASRIKSGEEILKQHPELNQVCIYYFDPKYGIFKSVALMETYQKVKWKSEDFLIWVDADVYPISEISTSFLVGMLRGWDAATLFRKHPGLWVEASFVAIQPVNGDRTEGAEILHTMHNIYVNGAYIKEFIFNDIYVWDMVLKAKDPIKNTRKYLVYNLTEEEMSSHVMETSKIRHMFEHYKDRIVKRDKLRKK